MRREITHMYAKKCNIRIVNDIKQSNKSSAHLLKDQPHEANTIFEGL
jgi:hypothetical protein